MNFKFLMAREELEITRSLPDITTRNDIIKKQECQIHDLNSTLNETLERITELSEELNDIKCAIIIHPYTVKESVDMIKDMKEFIQEDYVQQLFRNWKEQQEEKNRLKKLRNFKIEKEIEEYEQELKIMRATIPESIKIFENYREDYAKKLKAYIKNIKDIKLKMELNRKKKSN